nr:odorant receptor 23 [Holotrichia oblita]
MEDMKTFFSSNTFILKLSGMWWFLKQNNTHYKHVFYGIFCIIISQFYYLPSEWYRLKDIYSDFDNLINQLGMLLTHQLGMFKLLNIFLRRNRILNMIQTFQNSYDFESCGKFKPQQIIADHKKVARNAITLYFMLACCVPVTATISTAIQLSKMSSDEFNGGSEVCDSILPYYIVIPFDISTKISCCFALIFQILPFVVFAWQITAHDLLFAVFLIALKCHFIIVRGAFETLRSRCLKMLNLQPHYNILHDRDNIKLDNAMKTEMRKCTQYYQIIIKLAQEVENSFTHIILVQVLIVIFIMVSCLYMMSSLVITSGKFFAEANFVIAILIQITFYCWFGNEMTLASADICSGIYDNNWLSASESFKRSMLIQMIRSSRITYITVGKFSPVTLLTLASILRGSYSYFALLSNLKE